MTNNHIRKRIEDSFKGIYKSDINIDFLDLLTEEIFIYHHELELQNMELKRIQKVLEEKNLFLKEVFDNSPVLYFILDTEGKILMINQKAKNTFGFEFDDYKETSIQNLLAAEHQDDFYFFIKRLLVEKNPPAIKINFKAREQIISFHAIGCLINRSDNPVINLALTPSL